MKYSIKKIEKQPTEVPNSKRRRLLWGLPTIVTAIALLFLFSFLEKQFSFHERTLLLCAVGAASTVLALLLYRFREAHRILPHLAREATVPAVISFLYLMDEGRMYLYPGESFPFLGWTLAFAFAIAAVVTTVYKKDEVKLFHTVLSFLGAILCIVILFNPIPMHLNYLLDTEEPSTYEIVIVEKDRINHMKGMDEYRFIFELNGEERRINVPSYVYREHKIGDTYEIYSYNGAFGKPFYVGKH
ncbi:MAG: hypothetical protein IJ009_02755 [Clostridia bacterium]|nr:hypothetical protein [Clostridia bacterium]